MSSRSTSARHDQRGIALKPAKAPEGTTTLWIPAFVSSVEGMTEPMTIDSMIVLQLGATAQEREARLRKLSSMGVLKMRSVHVLSDQNTQEWHHYEWLVAS